MAGAFLKDLTSLATDFVQTATDLALNKTDLEKKLDEALSSKNWGASMTQLRELAAASHNNSDFPVIMRAVWSVVNTPDARTWKQIYKGLQLLDVLVRHGSERVIDDVRQQLFRIKALLHFEHAENARDQGAGIRDAAKKLIALLDDTALLRDERRKARALAKKVVGMSSDGSNFSGAGAGLSNSNFHDESPRRNGGGGGSGGDNAWSARGGSHNEDTEDNHDYYSSSTHSAAATDHYVPKAHASDLSARHTSRAAVRKGGRAHASTEADDEAFAAPAATDVDADFFGSAFAAAPAPLAQPLAQTDDLDFGPPVSAPARVPVPVSVPISAPRMQVNVRPQAVAVVASVAATSFDPFNYSGQGHGSSSSSAATRVVSPELDFFSTPAPSTAPIAAAAAAADFDPFGFGGSVAPPVRGAANPFANNAHMAPALASPSSDFGTFSSAAPAGLVDSDVDRLVSFDKLSLKGGAAPALSGNAAAPAATLRTLSKAPIAHNVMVAPTMSAGYAAGGGASISALAFSPPRAPAQGGGGYGYGAAMPAPIYGGAPMPNYGVPPTQHTTTTAATAKGTNDPFSSFGF